MWISIILSLLIMNAVIGMIHIKIFTEEFSKYRRIGKTLTGRQQNIFAGIAVVMFLVDNSGLILKAKYSVGFALFPDFENWSFPVGRRISELSALGDEIKKSDRRLPGAVHNAANNWNLHKQAESL